MQIEQIKKSIENNITEAIAIVSSADNIHYEAKVYSPIFSGLSLVKQHQLVYEAIGPSVGVDIHALALFTTADREQL